MSGTIIGLLLWPTIVIIAFVVACYTPPKR